MGRLESYRYSGEIETSSVLPPGAPVGRSSWTWDVVPPDRLHGTVGPEHHKSEFIVVGGDTYVYGQDDAG